MILSFRIGLISLAILLVHSNSVYAQHAKYKGQGEIKPQETASEPVQKQWKGVFELENGKLIFSNDFDGARLNGINQVNDSTVNVLITSENTPINTSPWYAFKVWSNRDRSINIHLTYQEGAKHRYFPKLSRNGDDWVPIDSAHYYEIGKGAETYGPKSMAKSAVMKVNVGPDTLWVAGQELHTSEDVNGWTQKMADHSFASVSEIGKSTEGRPLKLLTIGNKKNKKKLMVISRQHPPEVTGYLAMKVFIEEISSDSDLAKNFRKEYTIYVVPLMNPDGVDKGYWRHNSGGIDLNRDWADFNQPETRAVRNFMDQMIKKTGGRFYFGVDFHSTWDDIYYTVDPYLIGNMPGLVPKWFNRIGKALNDYEPNIAASSEMEPTTVSRNYFFQKYGAEALVLEVGDDTPRDFLRKKAEVSAKELMKLMLEMM
jgi:hypothetical protein